MSDPADWAENPEAQEFLRHAEEEMAPMLRDSFASVSLVPDDEGDAKFWVELGAAIMFEKPIMLVVVEGRPIPQKLQQVADEIVFVPEGEMHEAAGMVQEALARMLPDA